MNNIRGYIKDLSWSKPEEIQKKAIKKLENIRDEDIILLANQDDELCSKDCWGNAATVLKKIGYPRINPAIPYLMEWFQDINWPGVLTIIQSFKGIDTIILVPYIEEAMKRAVQEDDEMWCYWLEYLVLELNVEETDFKDRMVLYKIKTNYK